MDVRYINPFLASIQNVSQTMLGLPLHLGKPFIKPDLSPLYDISVTIGLTGITTGCVVMSLSKAMALELASALCQLKLTEIDDDVVDALGEITNMIAGSAKKDFPNQGTSVSIPSVTLGKHQVLYPSGVPIIAIPCETSVGRMVLDIALRTPPAPIKTATNFKTESAPPPSAGNANDEEPPSSDTETNDTTDETSPCVTSS